jgi:hypothetical protein
MTRRDVAALVAILAVASGCGASGAGAVSSHRSAVQHGATTTTASKAAFVRVKLGMPRSQVEALLGRPPFRLRSGSAEICWLYGESPSDLAGGQVCFTGGRVSFVATPPSATVTFGSTSGRAA